MNRIRRDLTPARAKEIIETTVDLAGGCYGAICYFASLDHWVSYPEYRPELCEEHEGYLYVFQINGDQVERKK